MEFSDANETEVRGQELLAQVISLTDLPEPCIRRELDEILLDTPEKDGQLTLDQLRQAMLAYLEKVHAELQPEPHL